MNLIKEFIQRIFKAIAGFFPLWKRYGFSAAISSFIFTFKPVMPKKLKVITAINKHKSILKYLYKNYSGLLKEYSDKNIIPSSGIASDSPIWICWWDGEDKMPPLAKICYNSIKKHCGKHSVILISKYNYKDYISIPAYIIEKVNKKIMTLTHFSNILRVNLLYDHGGIWLDTTILVLKEITLDNLLFFTLKTNTQTFNISHIHLQGLYDKPASFHAKNTSDINSWSGFLLAGPKHSLIFAYMRDILYAYWKNHNDQIDYLLFDYTIALGYENIPDMKKLIDGVEFRKYDKFLLSKKLNDEYSETDIKMFYNETFHKLTWKSKFKTHTKKGRLTNYGYLTDTFLNKCLTQQE